MKVQFTLLVVLSLVFYSIQKGPTTRALHTNGWNIYYNDSLIHSTNPLLKNNKTSVNRRKVHQLELSRKNIHENDAITIHYQSDVIRKSYGLLQVKDSENNRSLLKMNTNAFFLNTITKEEVKDSVFHVWYGETHKLKNQEPDYRSVQPIHMLTITFLD